MMFPPESSATASEQTCAAHNRASITSQRVSRSEKLLPEQALQGAGQPIGGLLSRGGEVPIHQLLRLCPVLDRQRLAQDCHIDTVLLGSAEHELTGQEVAEIPWSVEMQPAIVLQQSLRRKFLLAQFQ